MSNKHPARLGSSQSLSPAAVLWALPSSGLSGVAFHCGCCTIIAAESRETLVLVPEGTPSGAGCGVLATDTERAKRVFSAIGRAAGAAVRCHGTLSPFPAVRDRGYA